MGYTSIPKVSLHDHLDGGLRPKTLIELAALNGVELPAADPNQLARAIVMRASEGTLTGYLETFGWTIAVMQDVVALERIAYEAVLDLAEDGVVLGEVRFAPLLHTRNGLSPQQAIDAVVKGLVRGGKKTGVPVGLILCALRHQDEANQIVTLFESNWTDDGLVIGVDLAGPEAGFPVTGHPAFTELAARWPNAPITLHAGEAAGVQSIWDAVAAGARRIGHGTRLIDDILSDRKLLEVIRNRGIMLEVCLTSNYQTGAVDSISSHPLVAFLGEGVKVNIDVDNRLVSGTSQSAEIGLASALVGLHNEQLRAISRNALDASFMPAWAKKKAEARLRSAPLPAR